MTSEQFDALVNIIEILIDKHSCRPGYIDGYHWQVINEAREILVDPPLDTSPEPPLKVDARR